MIVLLGVFDAAIALTVILVTCIQGLYLESLRLHAREVPALQLLLKSQQVKGWYSGTSLDSQETLGFSVLSGVRSMNESFPLDRVNEAYERMEQGKARFRVVLTIGK